MKEKGWRFEIGGVDFDGRSWPTWRGVRAAAGEHLRRVAVEHSEMVVIYRVAPDGARYRLGHLECEAPGQRMEWYPDLDRQFA